MIVLLCIFGFISGITTVLFGFGGGFITVPLLFSLLTRQGAPQGDAVRFAMQIAVATSACVMIFSAGLSTIAHHRRGNLDWPAIRPFLGYLSLGGCIGAAAALALKGEWVRWLFIVYLAATIVDCFIRPGFLLPAATPSAIKRPGRDALPGIIIGIIASLLGVGGSVMTVPLMRRRGATMLQAAAMANPLTLPMAITGTATYLLLSIGKSGQLGEGFAGFVYLKGALLLAVGAWFGIRFAGMFMHRIPDSIHARLYPLLLIAVLCVMLAV